MHPIAAVYLKFFQQLYTDRLGLTGGKPGDEIAEQRVLKQRLTHHVLLQAVLDEDLVDASVPCALACPPPDPECASRNLSGT